MFCSGLLQVASVTTFLGVAALLVWRSHEVIAFLVALLLVSSVGADFPPNLFDLDANFDPSVPFWD